MWRWTAINRSAANIVELAATTTARTIYVVPMRTKKARADMSELVLLAQFLRARFEAKAENFTDDQMLEDASYALIHLGTFIDAAQALSLQEYRRAQSAKRLTAVPVVSIKSSNEACC